VPLEREVAQTPTDIGSITLTTTQQSSGSAPLTGASVTFEVLDATGQIIRTRSHDLLPHMTDVQKTNEGTQLTNLRAKIVTEVLGP
jgi:hypothetical protein